MRARLIQAWVGLRESYWFLPALCSLGAIGIAAIAITIDRTYGPWSLGWLPRIGPAGARSLLSTTAGSLITVAGVAFSVTLVALASMSSQFGPRLLLLVMRDRGIQAALAIFSALFIYCLILLLFVRAPGETGDLQMFVPQTALLLAFLGGVLAIGAFIYLVHHVAQMIQVGNVVARAGTELLDGIERMATERQRDGVTLVATRASLRLPDAAPVEVRAERHGHLQVVDAQRLVESARAWDATIVVEHRIGEFVTEDGVIARLWRDRECDDECLGAVRGAFAWGNRRTHAQDVRYQVDQIVQIGARALSPSLNDPFTAMTCIDWLEAALQRFAALPGAAWLQLPDDGHGTVLTPVTTLEELLLASFGQLTPYTSADINAALHQARALRRLIAGTDAPGRLALLHQEVDRLALAARERLGNPAELERLEAVLEGSDAAGG